MTLQASGSMTIADINTELGRSAGAQLSTDDTELLGMANLTSSDTLTIPDDLYGKTYIGALYGTYNITVGARSSLYGYESPVTGFSTGSINITTYRGANIRWFLSRTNTTITFDIVLDGSYPSDFITGVRFVTDGGTEFFPTDINNAYNLGGTSGWNFYDGVPSSFIWDAGDVGVVKQVKIYGAP